jgi:type I restriction enzyme M protein
MYEYLLSKLSASGTNGQFRTPRHIIDLMVSLVDPQPGQRICDPACGTAGFLISAFTHILRQHTKLADLKRGLADGGLLKPAQWKFLEEHAFTGFDNDANMVKIAILNLYLHQLEKARVSMLNPLTTGFGGAYPGQRFDIILANPPFAGKVQDESILSDLNYKLNTRATELLFLKWFIDHLAPGGRAGVIVPNGVLFGSTNAATSLRELLLTECDLQAVISLPSGVFKPYSGVGTAALIFQKAKPTQSVWFYDLTADGYSLDDKRTTSPQTFSATYSNSKTQLLNVATFCLLKSAGRNETLADKAIGRSLRTRQRTTLQTSRMGRNWSADYSHPEPQRPIEAI